MSEESLFHQALGKPAGERGAFLERACGPDAGLRRRLEALLQAHDNPGSFLGQPAANPGATAPAGPPGVPAGRVGPYKLLRLIGEGGMGAVWLAEQTHPVVRLVALKVI